MCGIFAYIGTKNNAASTVLDGLKLLEYRGYDSWGIAVKTGESISVDKHVGKIGEAKTTLPESSIGIGHTRWATHGGVTVKNAHPHLDCTKKIALLHNGIIENYQELKDTLLKQGHTFVSQTDTEVAVHLIEELLKSHDFQTSVKLAFHQLHGMNAIVVLNETTSEVIAAKNGSPLIVGQKGAHEFYIASDASGILPHTRKILFLKDNELVKIGTDLQLYSLPKGTEIKPHFEMIDWKIEAADKGKHAHFMIKEIEEQPTVVRNIANNYDDQIKKMADVIKKAQGTFFIAAGTAYHACLGGVYLFSKVAHKHVNTALASEFNYLLDFLNDKSLVIALSQSGETIDVIEPLTHAQAKGAKIVGITNTLGSTIYRMSDYKMLLGAGPEKAVASTKAYLAKLAVFLLLAYQLDGGIQKIKPNMLTAATEIEKMTKKPFLQRVKKLAKLLAHKEHIYTLGRGASYTSAIEAALKIKEVSYIHTEGLAGGELKHGTIALISKGTPVIVFAPNDETYDAMISNATEVKARGAFVIGISPKKADIFDEWIEMKDLGDATLLTQIVPAQLLGYYLALELGYDPDKPRNLAKSVTVK
jgi:glucosamine--fructose-6-phosphate aminotransferase (isomerizing)